MKRYPFLLPMVFVLTCASFVVFAGPGAANDGFCAAITNTCTLTTAAGDLKLTFAYRSAGASIPTLPAGWTSIDSGTGSTEGWNFGCNKSSSSGDTGTGTWTNANAILSISYPGTSVGTTANCNTTGIGGFAHSTGAASTSVSYPTITMTNATDWVIGFGADKTLAVCLPSANPGTLNQVASAGTGPSVKGGDTGVAVSSWATSTCTTTSSIWATEVAEILSPSGTPNPNMPPAVYWALNRLKHILGSL